MPEGITLDNSQIGVRLELSDTIFEAHGEETPFFTRVPKSGPQFNVINQQPADVPGHVAEGGDADNTPAPPPSNQSEKYDLIETIAEVWRGTVAVGYQAAYWTNRAGVVTDGKTPGKQLMAREVYKVLRALHTTIDRELCSSRDQRAPAGALGPKTRGIGSWISATAQGERPVPEQFRPGAGQIYDGAWDDFNMEKFEDILEECYNRTGFSGTYTGYCGIAFKRTVTNWSVETAPKQGFTNMRMFKEGADQYKLIRDIRIVEFDAGDVEFVKSRNLNYDSFGADVVQTAKSKQTCYLIPDAPITASGGCELLTTQKPILKTLDDDGSGERKFVIGVFALKANPTGCGKISPSGNAPDPEPEP